MTELLQQAIQQRLEALRSRRLTQAVPHDEREVEIEQAPVRALEELRGDDGSSGG